MSHYRQMQTFAAVAQAGSLAAAARHLQQSQATVMRAIAALEARLHNTLLIRGPRGVELSPAGEQFAQSCRQILEQTEQAERSAAGLHASPEGRLTVALPLLMDLQVFTPIALAYLEAYPDVHLAIRTSDGAPRLLKDGIDVALVVGPLPSSSEFALPLGTVTPVVCASPAYLAKWGRPTTPDDLKSHRTVMSTSPGYEAQWHFPNSRTTRLLKPAHVLSCTTQRAAIHAATLGLGLIRCMSYEAHDELHSGLLEAVLTDFASPGVPAQLIYRHGRRAEARVRSFIDFATPLLRAHPAFAG
ncbi:LysR family transcriptional regulator [Aquipseudomonas ullengensis]|uniref:LysR family transcriptional regulator n=1 Tax=Aquipseudomonas ullengensis TaxID=2759166 RepID=A0A7W4QEE1_9GAMM|nr:LysR family transcriptional regulator [Pseudomonas ullengensis]MBB2497056.1 LysR family transcriptional regulator [Pseudomonas ullengensis]